MIATIHTRSGMRAVRSAPSSFMGTRTRSVGDDVNGTGRRAMGWETPGSGPNSALLTGIQNNRSKSRHAVSSNTTAKRLVDNLVVNVIDTGIRPRTPFPQLQKLWERWTDEADSRGQLDFYGMQALAFRSMVEGGDCFVRFRSRRPGDMDTVPLQLQLLEGEHCPTELGFVHANNNVVNGGVERDGTDYPAAYWLYRHHPRDFAALLDVLDCRWDVPARGYINPLQEVAAYIAAVAAGFTSRERVANELGNEASEIDLENASSKARSTLAGLDYSVYSPQSAGAAALLAAKLETESPSDIEMAIKDTAHAEVSSELEKTGKKPAKLRPVSKPKPKPEPQPTA